MNRDAYRFRLGEFECVSARDGTFNYPPHVFFASAPQEALEAVLRQQGLPLDRIETLYTCLFVDTGAHRVLIDTGAGRIGEVADKMVPGVDHSTSETGRLPGNLKGAGIDPGDIDAVIITHAHPDHVGGTLDEQGALLFGNARYYIAKNEWDFWISDAAEAKASPSMVETARRNLEPLRERLTLVEDGFEIVPGVRVVATYGHTPGHIALSVTSGEQQLIHISDTALHPLHLAHPAWRPALDMNPDEASASRRRLFDRIAAEEALVFSHHFAPFPNLGHVVKAGEGWRWRPLVVEG